jgi:hypothetical protein
MIRVIRVFRGLIRVVGVVRVFRGWPWPASES